MKLVVIGNCQAQPLATRLSTAPSVSVAAPIIVHLARDEDEAAHAETIGGADLILAQATTSSFRPRHLASDTLQDAYPGRVLTWPSLFYAGQQPFLRYLTHHEEGRVSGPFGAYHDLRLLAAWRAERGLGPTPPDHEVEMRVAADIARKSLAELHNREARCDVGVADLVERAAFERRSFYTFNHPAGWLLEQLAQRVAARLGLPPLPTPPDDWDPLSRMAPPGVSLTSQPASLWTTTFCFYDDAASLLAEPKSLRTTPDFDSDSLWLG